MKIDLSEIIAFARKEETIKILRNFVNDGIDSGTLGRFHLRNVNYETLDTLFNLEEDFHDDMQQEMYKLFPSLSKLRDVNYALALVHKLISMYFLKNAN